jgi:hypothetical protein
MFEGNDMVFSIHYFQTYKVGKGSYEKRDKNMGINMQEACNKLVWNM